MSTPIDWDARIKQINENFKNAKGNTPFGKIIGPSRITIPVRIEKQEFYRKGFLSWAVVRLKYETADGCKTQEQEIKNATAVVTLTKEEVKTVAKSFSSSATNAISSGISSEISATAGNDLVGKVEAKIGAQITGSQENNKTSTLSLEQQVKSAISSAETVELTKAPPVCQKIRVPFGLELNLSLIGRVTIERLVIYNALTKVYTFDDKIEIIVDFKLDISIDTAIDYENARLTKTKCESCPKKGGDGDGQDEKEKEGKRSGRTEPRKKPSKQSKRPLKDIEGIGPKKVKQLNAVGVKTLNELYELPANQRIVDISPGQLEKFQKMALWLIEYEQFDGDDAELLVEGLGLQDPDDLEIGQVPTEFRVLEGIGAIQTPEDYNPQKVLDLLEKCRCR